MRKTIKLFSILFVVACFTSCDEGSDLGFAPSPEMGWIQFVEGEPAVIYSNQADQAILRLGVDIQVPTTSSDLTISYNLVPVSGMNPNTAFSNNGAIVVPAGETSYMGPDNSTGINYVYLPTIDFDVSDIAGSLAEPMIFDVVLSGTSSGNITVGLDGEAFPTTQRIAICPSLDSSTGNLLGDYVLTVPTGAGPFGVVFTDDQVVSVTEGNNGSLSRLFQADYLPAIGAGNPVVDVEFLLENGEVTVLDGISTGLGCASEILLNGDSGSVVPLPCGDAVITLMLLDFAGGSGGCGVGDVPVTIILTKV